ncbi:hypothetical protein GN244_ATG16926 [Phytophthora infestans]|uniref:Uncharacterized protein n=1 Tax=Phytophthora infestans TaxID=4787 RepID=A0A833SI03_PHYIN|nr:hypothetical protein GN244_ATG16926 [Phytophthora infestans]
MHFLLRRTELVVDIIHIDGYAQLSAWNIAPDYCTVLSTQETHTIQEVLDGIKIKKNSSPIYPGQV